MTTLGKNILIGAVLLLATATSAEDAHHTPKDSAIAPPTTASEPPAQSDASAAGNVMSGMMSGQMMSGGRMSDGMMKMMMDMMSGGGGPMGQMMSPERVEGRIAFIKTELKVSEAQQPLWDAVADALRENARAAKEMMAGMPAGMMSMDPATGTPVERIELHERMLSTRLEGLQRLKTALEPFYSSLDGTQKAVADKLLLPAPMGMM